MQAFLILTAARSAEVGKAAWSQIDMGDAMWTLSAERMKANREHHVLLSGHQDCHGHEGHLLRVIDREEGCYYCGTCPRPA